MGSTFILKHRTRFHTHFNINDSYLDSGGLSLLTRGGAADQPIPSSESKYLIR
jgi:hypothetical protein